MNIFRKLLAFDAENETKLGIPLTDPAARERRMNTMFTIRAGKGFRQQPMEPRIWGDGTTRGERKRKLRAYAWGKEMERQAAEVERIVKLTRQPRADVIRHFGSVYA